MAMLYTMILFGLRISACVLALAIASYLYAIALSKVVKGCLFSIHRSAQAKTDQATLLDQAIEFLEVHSSAKQLSDEFRLAWHCTRIFYFFEFRSILLFLD